MRKGVVRRFGWVLVLLGLAPAGPAFAANGLAFLKVGAGARSVAVGDAVVSHVDDASATSWNPGALPLLGGTNAELMHNESFGGVRFEFASLTRGFGRHGLGVSFQGIWTDRMRGYDSAGNYEGDFGYYGLVLGGSYGFSPWERLGVGVGLEYVREAIDVYDASGMGVTLGAQYREILPRTDIGVAVRHLGSAVKYEQEEVDLPTAVQGGVTHRLPLSSLGSAVLLAVEGRKVRDEDGQVLVGAEYQYQNVASLGVGYRSGLDTEDVSLGVGIGQGRIRGQYAFVPFQENLGDQHRISLLLNLP